MSSVMEKNQKIRNWRYNNQQSKQVIQFLQLKDIEIKETWVAFIKE